MKSYAPSEKSGGGTLKETTLWTNSAPTSQFAGITVTLSSPIDGFDLICFKYRSSTTNANTYTTYFITSEFLAAVAYQADAIVPVIGTNHGVNYVRMLFPDTSSKVKIEGAMGVNTSSVNNNYTITTEIIGIKF